MDELKPCPFCGGTAVVDGKSDDLRVRCEGCDSDDQDDIDQAERDAIAQWNRRAA
jgi:Lar family restriction alleviation protein